MRLIPAFLACAFLAASPLVMTSSARADSRVFIIANQPDGYGIDLCLAKSEPCGASAARAYCRSREYTEASAYRRVEPDEITNTVPVSANATCKPGGCGDYVAITCQR